ncbi:MAG: flagellin [Pseudomonadota bacterium]
MGLRIGTNVGAINARRNMWGNNIQMERSMARLSSGYRINQAADDAAGLAISENLKAQIRGLRQASRNAQDGISMVQVAEGSLNEVSNMIVRLRELSIQASSDTLGDTERKFIDVEYQQLKSEIQRIAENTSFNGYELLNGSAGVMDIQVGTQNDPFEDRISFNASAANTTLEALGILSENVASKFTAQKSINAIDDALVSVNAIRANFGAMQNRLASTTNNLSVTEENFSAANSRVRDTDIAAESSELVRNSILQQAAVSILSQANNSQQLALKLLG